MRVKPIASVVLLGVVSAAYAGPDAITYQGSLLNPDLGPLPDGAYELMVEVFPCEFGGSGLFITTGTIELRGGLFSTEFPLSAFDGLFSQHGDLWIEVTVDLDRSGAYEPGERFLPRQRVGGAPWSVPRLEPNSTCPNLIGGFPGNMVWNGVAGGTIAGGGEEAAPNLVTDIFGSVGGGRGNQAGNATGTASDARYATVAGGIDNMSNGIASTIAGGNTNLAGGNESTVGGGHSNVATGNDSTVAGGRENAASGDESCIGGGLQNAATNLRASVGGGRLNRATGDASTVGGGYGNIAGGFMSTVPGGLDNAATASYSLAAGRRAKASHPGAFVWADSTDADFGSSGENRFRVRATGGVAFVTGFGIFNEELGAWIGPGDTAWSFRSNRELKENIEPVDTREMLARLIALPIAEWNYRGQEDSLRHVGPMAEDFRAAFDVGRDDGRISTIDINGVALAAIQGLHQVVKEKDLKIAELNKRNDDLEMRVSALEAFVMRIVSVENVGEGPANPSN